MPEALRYRANKNLSVRHPDGREVDYRAGDECVDVPAGFPNPADVDQGLLSPIARPGRKPTKSSPAAGASEENA